MKLRFTKRAAEQIDKALDCIAEQSPQGASRVRERIRAVATLLMQHPFAGHATDLEGVRRIVVSPYPYLIFYRVTDKAVIVQRFRHAARNPSSVLGRA